MQPAVSPDAVDAEPDELEGCFAVGMDLGECAIEGGPRHWLFRHGRICPSGASKLDEEFASAERKQWNTEHSNNG